MSMWTQSPEVAPPHPGHRPVPGPGAPPYATSGSWCGLRACRKI